MKRPKIGLTIAMLLLTIILLGLMLFIGYTSDENNVLHLGDYKFIEYYDGTVVKAKGSAVIIKNDDIPEVKDAVLVRTETGLRILFVKAVDFDTIYLNDINGDIAEAVSINDDLIGEVEYYIPFLGYLINLVNSQNCIYLLLGFVVFAFTLFAILVIKMRRMNKASNKEIQENKKPEMFTVESEADDKNEKTVDEVFQVFFNIDYTMNETKSLVKMILNSKSEKLKVGIIGARKQLVIEAIKGYIKENEITNVNLSESGVFSYIEFEKDFTVTLCSIILNLKRKLSESERDTNA